MDNLDYKQFIKDFHKLSDRHILVVETDMLYSNVLKIVNDSNNIRKAGNELVAIMKKNYEQLIRTKKYRKLLKLYGSTHNKKKRKGYAKQLNEMQKQYNITWDFCRKAMIPIGKKYNIGSIFGLTKAEDVWSGVENILYSSGKTLHFSKYNDLPCIKAKQIHKGIILKIEQDVVYFTYKDIKFTLKIKDKFQQDELNALLDYVKQPEVIDRKAIQILQEEAYCIDTYRPCYCTLVPKYIRGKWRIYLHITIEGKALLKYNKDGTLRHYYGNGVLGVDIGTQTIAYTSKNEVGLKNLAERGNAISTNERKERLIYRAMDRSRRATNPDNYNEDGTIKKGPKTWVYSKHYKKLKAKHTDLCRKNAINRHLAIQEDINYLRSLANIIVTEPKNANSLKKKSKETTKNSKGKYNKKKRFGKSIQNRCPGYFQSEIKKKFTTTNGTYIEVPNNYRASQYDHTIDDYIKKKLSDRLYKLRDGTQVQRDWYSSYLLYCYNIKTQEIDKEKCIKEFNYIYQKELKLIDWIIRNKIKILNSGIKVN